MRDLLEQLERSLHCNNYLLTLMVALTIPDIGGALNSEDGLATGQKYKDWFEDYIRPQFAEVILESMPLEMAQHVPPMENPFTGDACYRFRCSLLHQGTTQHPQSPYSRIIFIEPGTSTNFVHYCIMADALCIDLKSFCKEMIRGTRQWLEAVEGTEQFQRNYDLFVKRYPTGLAPYIVGVPVVG